MNIISYRFFYSLRWGAIESTVYQLLFVGHHAALFALCPAGTYGVVGILFSALFTIIGLCNLGLDLLLAPHIASWSQSKKELLNFFGRHLPPTLITIITVIALTGLWWGSSHLLIWMAISGAILIESVRKTLRTLLRLTSYNREVALIEIGTFLFYMTIVWGWYWHTTQFSVLNIFLPLVIAGSVSTLLLLLCARVMYATLPLASSSTTQLPPLSTRIPLVTHQITSTLLSPNILVLLCSLRLEIIQIGSVKFISTLIHSMALILNKSFGTATAVLYATQQMTSMRNTHTANLLQATFSLPFTILLAILTLGVGGTYVSGTVMGVNLLLTLALSVSTSYLATYEQLFVSQSSTSWLLWPNSITLIILIGLSQLPYPFSATILMSIFLLLRIATALLLSHIAARRWQISPLLQPKIFFMATSFVAVILVLMIIKPLR